MERTALLTGSVGRVAEVAPAMEHLGFSVIGAERPFGAAAEIRPASLDCYVQLPSDIALRGDTLVERVREFLAAGLLARFEEAGAVLPLLRREARVVLVAGHVPAQSATLDDHHARTDLLRVLARAILSQCSGSDLKAIVLGPQRSPADIAEIASGRSDPKLRRLADYAALPPDLSYADWQREVLSLTTTEE